HECRNKEGETLNVIPMRMADQEVNSKRSRATHEFAPEFTNTRSAIQDNQSVVRRAEFHAGGVATVNRRLISRGWYRTPRSPKSNLHPCLRWRGIRPATISSASGALI